MPVTPIGALTRGLAAGAAGSFTMDRFMTYAMKVLPDLGTPKFEPPEQEQRGESPTATVARRLYEAFMQRGPIGDRRKANLGTFVHYAFGAGWSGLYGLIRESIPGARGPLAGIALGSAVWGLGDYGIVPAFRLGAGFRDTPPRMIAFTYAAHLVYGLTAWAAYESSRPRTWAAIAATAFALKLDRKARRSLPATLMTRDTRRVIRRAASRAVLFGTLGAGVPRAVANAMH